MNAITSGTNNPPQRNAEKGSIPAFSEVDGRQQGAKNAYDQTYHVLIRLLCSLTLELSGGGAVSLERIVGQQLTNGSQPRS